MSTVQALEPGSRYDLRVGISPDAPDEDQVKDEEGAFGYCHSYESSSRYDGPGLRVVLFVSGCLLRCTYCHNPDTWHLKDGTYASVDQVLRRLGDFAPSIRDLGGGLTISGGEPMVQLAFTRRIFAGARKMGLHTAVQTSGFLGDRADEAYLVAGRPRSSRHQEFGPARPTVERPAAIWRRRFASPSVWPRCRSRSGFGSRWCPARPTIPQMSTALHGSWRP